MVGGDIEESETAEMIFMFFVGNEVEQSVFVFGAGSGEDLEWAHDRRLESGRRAVGICDCDILSNAIEKLRVFGVGE